MRAMAVFLGVGGCGYLNPAARPALSRSVSVERGPEGSWWHSITAAGHPPRNVPLRAHAVPTTRWRRD